MSGPFNLRPLPVALAMLVGASPCGTHAQTTPPPADQPTALAPVVVKETTADPQHLKAINTTASRLGLNAKEIPAVTEVRTQEDMEVRGLRTTKEVFADVTGATAGNVPGNPAVVSMRGFSGNAITVLQDGVRVSASTVVIRDLDTWNYERVEVLKGPASVLYGEGALGGTINLVTKKATLDGPSAEGLVSVGSFNTRRVAVGGNLPVSPTVAVRGDVSYLDSDSLYDVDRQNTHALGVTGSVLYKPNDQWSSLVAVDHFDDRYECTYQGSPLLPESVARHASNILQDPYGLVVDRSLRSENYNPDGAHSGAVSTMLRWNLTWHPSETWTLANDASIYEAKRSFVLAGEQVYAPATGLFTRTAQRITHDHRFWNDRLLASNDTTWGAHRNRFAIGAEANGTRLTNPRQNGTTTSVDPFDPAVGIFPSAASVNWPGAGKNVVYRSRLINTAVFLEDAFNLTPDWLLTGGVRYERINLHRTITDLNTHPVTAFHPTYDPFSWRVGTVYNLTPSVQLFAQHASAVTPVSSLLLIASANGGFDLSHGTSDEAGLKWQTPDGATSLTGSVYRIHLDDILTRDPNDPALTVQGGSQTSRGAEVTVTQQVNRGLQLNAGLSYVDAAYDTLLEAGGANRQGNRPINIPRTVVNASALYRIQSIPLTLGLFAKHAGDFYTDTANTYRVKGHTTLDASAEYDWSKVSLTARVRNLTNAFYGEYSGYAATQVYIGAPRSLELSLRWRM